MLFDNVITIAEHFVDSRRQVNFTNGLQTTKEDYKQMNGGNSVSLPVNIAAQNRRRVLHGNPNEVVEQRHVGDWLCLVGNLNRVLNLK